MPSVINTPPTKSSFRKPTAKGGQKKYKSLQIRIKPIPIIATARISCCGCSVCRSFFSFFIISPNQPPLRTVYFLGDCLLLSYSTLNIYCGCSNLGSSINEISKILPLCCVCWNPNIGRVGICVFDVSC